MSVLKCCASWVIYSPLKTGEEGAGQKLPISHGPCAPGLWFPSSFTLKPDTTKSFCSQKKDGKIKKPLPISLGNSEHHWQAFSHPIMTLILPILVWQAKLPWFQLLVLGRWKPPLHSPSLVKNGSGEQGQAANGHFSFTMKAVNACYKLSDVCIAWKTHPVIQRHVLSMIFTDSALFPTPASTGLFNSSITPWVFPSAPAGIAMERRMLSCPGCCRSWNEAHKCYAVFLHISTGVSEILPCTNVAKIHCFPLPASLQA